MAYRAVLTPYGLAVVQVNPIHNLLAARVPYGDGTCQTCGNRAFLQGRATCDACRAAHASKKCYVSPYASGVSPMVLTSPSPSVQECASMYCHNKAITGQHFCEKCSNVAKACNICKRNKRNGLDKVCVVCKSKYNL